MNVSPIRSGHRGRPRCAVHIGRISFSDFSFHSLAFVFYPFNSDLFPDSCLCYCAFPGAYGCLRSLRQLLLTYSRGPLFSVTFKGASRTIDGRLFYDVSKVVFVGVVHESDQ